MTEGALILKKPGRWDVPFGPHMRDDAVDRILSVQPFKAMDPDNFPERTPLREILLNDTRLTSYGKGEIVVRDQDYGNSAFFVVNGSVRLVISPDLDPSMLGRQENRRKGLWGSFAQLWSHAREPEARKVAHYEQDYRLRTAQDEEDNFRVFLDDVPRMLAEHKTAAFREGDFFGVSAALSRMPHTGTVFAESDGTELLEIRWQGFRELRRYEEGLRAHIDDIYRERGLKAHLRTVPIFRFVGERELEKIAAETEFHTYGEYDWSGEYKRKIKAQPASGLEHEPVIVEEGRYPNGMVLVRAGFARVSQRFGHSHRTLSYLGTGHHYGLTEIFHNWKSRGETMPYQYTLRAIGYTHVLTIPTPVVEEFILAQLPREEWPRVDVPEEGDREAGAAAATEMHLDIPPDLLEFFAENRFINGTASMLINLDRCTRCDDCVRACSATHDNNPRFLRKGPVMNNMMVANACMHCADPVCMLGCPTGAIHRHAFGGQVVINDQTCIGCGACAGNCPYDAIRMVEVRDRTGAALVAPDGQPIVKATKCDLCVDQLGGPSCQRACPHNALRRVDMRNLESVKTWLQA